jgi:para-nitrobenzyl esterase
VVGRRSRFETFVAALAICLFSAHRASGTESCADVTTSLGAVHGAVEDAVIAYKGIPYAAAPLGDRRFRPPAPVEPWSGIRDATRFAPPCVAGEDCLYVNVWRPDCASLNLPVLVFFHPGMHTGGSAVSSIYNLVNGIPWFNLFNGATLASAGQMIVVSFDYRFGPLGFLADPALSAEDPHGSSGNYGILDQIAAFDWVHENIHAFGGNQAHVTAFGQSIGATDVCTLLVSPMAKGLFSRAILSSEPGCSRPTLAWAQANQGAQIVTKVGCAGATDVPACLRSRTHAQLMAAYNPTAGDPPYRPDLRLGGNIDGWVLPENPVEAIAQGRLQGMPILLGTTTIEYANLVGLMLAQFGPAATPEQYQAHIQHWFGVYGQDVVDAVLAQYPSNAFGTPTSTLIRVLTDAFLTAPQRRLARALWGAQAGDPSNSGSDDAARRARVRRYVFTHGLANEPLNFGAAHGADLPFIFGNLNLVSATGQTYSPTPGELALSATTQFYFSAFLWAANPNFDDAVVWPPLDGETDRYLAIGDSVEERRGFRTADCDFWDRWLPEAYPYVVP